MAPQNPDAALYVIAIGNPLGVFVALAIQLPALKRNGIRCGRASTSATRRCARDALAGRTGSVRHGENCSFVVVSVQNAAAWQLRRQRPSILLYARQWFTLPHCFWPCPSPRLCSPS